MAASLKILSPGAHTTVQDLGRFGYQDIGVPPSGALDPLALRLANSLVGNSEHSAALEILHHGPTLEVAAESVRVALAGVGASLEILGAEARLVPPWRSVTLQRGETIRVAASRDSACCYLAVAGGFDLPACLGSRATYARAHLGGFEGRRLAGGDELSLVLDAAPEGGELCLAPPPNLGPAAEVRVVLGPQLDDFTEEAIETFLGADFTVSVNSDRMGMRLDGPRLAHRDGFNIISDGVVTGAVQVPGSGQPILLLADRQTTGGYPKIATVISADLPALGRCKPGSRLRFRSVEVAEAEAIRREQEAEIARIISAIAPLDEGRGVNERSLHGDNLISGVVSGSE
jgi:allophanate hydrolase